MIFPRKLTVALDSIPNNRAVGRLSRRLNKKAGRGFCPHCFSPLPKACIITNSFFSPRHSHYLLSLLAGLDIIEEADVYC
jgi:hypothetical protein